MSQSRPEKSDSEEAALLGRDARRPSAIPFPGWRDIALRLWNRIGDHRISLTSAGVAFYAMLAMLPTMVAFVSIYGLLTDVTSIPAQLDLLAGIVPGQSLELMRDELTRIAQVPRNALSLSFAVSLVLSIWSTNNAVRAMFEAMNIAYGETESRPFLRQVAMSLIFTVSGIAFSIVALNVVVVAPIVLTLVTFGTFTFIGGAAVPLTMFVLLNIAVSLLYRFGPNRKPAKWQWITPGSLAATLMWFAGSAAFAFYLSNWGDYTATYGSLGAVIGLLIWLFISSFAIIFGAEINAAIEHQTAEDSTIGRDRPMGERGAFVADTLGKNFRD